MYSSGYSCRVLMEFELSRQIFKKKILKYQISRKTVQWEPSCSMRTDRQTWRSSFFEFFSKAPKNPDFLGGENDVYNINLSSVPLGVRKPSGVNSRFHSTSIFDTCGHQLQFRISVTGSFINTIFVFWCRLWFQSIQVLDNCCVHD